MAQEMSSKAVDLTELNTGDAVLRAKSKQKQQGELVFGVRIDSLPKGEAEALAKEGHFYPLTTDDKGRLRAMLPSDQQVVVRDQALLLECRNFLQRIWEVLCEMK